MALQRKMSRTQVILQQAKAVPERMPKAGTRRAELSASSRSEKRKADGNQEMRVVFHGFCAPSTADLRQQPSSPDQQKPKTPQIEEAAP